MLKNKKIAVIVIIICACVLVESFFSAFPYFAFVAGRKGETFEFLKDSSEIVSSEDPDCFFSFDSTVLNSVSFTVRPIGGYEDEFYADVTVYASSENSPGSFGVFASRKTGVDAYSGEKKIYLDPGYKSAGILLRFSDIGDSFVISDVKINPEFIFNMNYLRLVLLIAAAMLVFCIKEYKQFFRKISFRNAAIITAALCAFGSVLFSGVCATTDGAEPVEYIKGMDVSRQNPYVQQFDAFEKGQLNIDVEPDPALLELKNPYDPEERSGVFFLWDRAYKDGKYYSYFGTAPICTVYYPFYFLTGKLPAESTVMAVFAFIVSVFLPLAVMLLSRLINSNISPWFASITAFGALGASMVFLLQRGFMPFYYIASLSAMAFGAMAVFWWIFAFSIKKRSAKTVSFALSGLSYAFCIHSRLNIAFSIGIVIAAAAIAYFVKSVKAKEIKASVINILAFCVPVGIGGILAMWYNYARFSNPFDFGTAYQMTVADTSTYKISLNGFFPMLYQYFIRPFEMTSEFPYLYLKTDNISDLGKYIYTDANIGIFAMPFMFALPAAFCIFRNRSVSKYGKSVLGAALASMLITAFADICLGGVIFRYTADISLIGVIASAGILFEIYNICIREGREETKGILIKASSVLCGANILVTMASMLTLNGNLAEYLPSVFEYLRSFVVFWK